LETTYVQFDRDVTKILVEIDPTLQPYVNKAGNLVCQLQKALYGLRNSSRAWYLHLKRILEGFGLTACKNDPAVFFKMIGSDIHIVDTHSDDMLSVGPRHSLQAFREHMKMSVREIKIQEDVHTASCLGTVLKRHFRDRSIEIPQPALLKKVFTAVEHYPETSRPVNHPYFPNFHVDSPVLVLKLTRLYQSVLMMISFLARWSRPDLKFAVALLASKMHQPTQNNFQGLLTLVAYVKATKDLVLKIRPKGMQLYASVDSAFALHPSDRKSHAGIIVFLGGTPVSVISQKMRQVDADPTMAEMGALSGATKEILWWLLMLTELGFRQQSVRIEQDNSSSILLTKRGTGYGRSRYFEASYFYTKQYLDWGVMHLVKVESSNLLADYLTKPLTKDHLRFSRTLLGIY
jgi:hypothetical protein